MKNRRIIAGTVLAAGALCWVLGGGTAKVDTVPAATAESAVSATCAPQTQPIDNIIIEEPVTKSETIPVAGSVASPAQETPNGSKSKSANSAIKTLLYVFFVNFPVVMSLTSVSPAWV